MKFLARPGLAPGAMIRANSVLDDLFKYLLDKNGGKGFLEKQKTN